MKRIIILIICFFITACGTTKHDENFTHIHKYTIKDLHNQLDINSQNEDLYKALSMINDRKKRSVAHDLISSTIEQHNSDKKIMGDAQMLLGTLYLAYGLPEMGIKLIDLSANKNNAYAQYSMANYYSGGAASGSVVRRNDAKRFEYLKKAAENNHAEAQFFLGIAYVDGSGVKADSKKSLYWWKRSCENNYKQACTSYDNVINSINNYKLNN